MIFKLLFLRQEYKKKHAYITDSDFYALADVVHCTRWAKLSVNVSNFTNYTVKIRFICKKNGLGFDDVVALKGSQCKSFTELSSQAISWNSGRRHWYSSWPLASGMELDKQEECWRV